MEEKRLAKLALGCSLIGIVLLLIVAETQEIPTKNIGEITAEEKGKKVQIKGEITTLKETAEITLAKVQDATGEIAVIMFRKEGNLRQGDQVNIEGIVREYKKQGEIEAKVVKVVRDARN